ncbi:MAG: hypothetical protein O2894_04080 [Planctomycetota bacterium]|nr:hypothetical protein [Planctomycetota bacterium]
MSVHLPHAVRTRPGGRVAVGLPLLGLFALLVFVAGCSTPSEAEPEGPIAPSFEPIEFGTGANPRRDEQRRRMKLDEDAAGWQEKLDLARRYADGGYDDEALQVLDGALAQGPAAPWGDRLRAQRQTLTMRRAEEVLLRAEARGVQDYVAFETGVAFVIRLRNVSTETVTIHAPARGDASTSPSALLLEISRRDRDVHATQLRRTWNRTVFLQQPGDAPIVIAPGAIHEIPLVVPPEAAGSAIAGVRTLEISGTLRPTDLRRGSTPRRITLKIRPGRVMALPAGFEPLTVDPLRSMETALQTVAPAHLLVASEFVPPSRRDGAMQILARALGEGHPALYRAALGSIDLLRERAVGEPLEPLAEPLVTQLDATPARADALMEGLSTLTGVRLAPDPRLWREWLRRESERKRTVTARHDG